MSVSYDSLWKSLIDKRISQTDMRKVTGIAPNTLTKMKKDEDVSLRVLGKICKALDCDFKDMVEYYRR
jgi:DNA-binding Xre family transcriptional regulator